MKARIVSFSKDDAKLTAKKGMFVSIITTEYEKERDEKISRIEKQNLRLLKKYDAKLTLGSNAYGRTPLKGAIAISKSEFSQTWNS